MHASFIGSWELVGIGLLILLLFGGKKIPEVASGLGKGIRIFRKTLSGDDEENQSEKKKLDEKKENSDSTAN